MYKILFIFIVFGSLFNSRISGQTVYSSNEQSTFSFTLGMTATGLYRDTISYSTGILVNGGISYQLAFSKKSMIGIECLFSGKAFNRSSPIVKYRFIYLDFPVYYEYKFSNNIRGDVGVQYSKYVNSKYYYIDGAKGNGVHDEPLATRLSDDFGLVVGAEFGFAKNLFVGARYTVSTNSFSAKTPYTNVFQLSFKVIVFRGYKQILGKNDSGETNMK